MIRYLGEQDPQLRLWKDRTGVLVTDSKVDAKSTMLEFGGCRRGREGEIEDDQVQIGHYRYDGG